MKLTKRIFFDTEFGDQGHVAIHEKTNGNLYLVFYIEEKYKAYQEYTADKTLVAGERQLGFRMKNQVAYDKDFNITSGRY